MPLWAEYEEKEFETLSNVALVTEQILLGRRLKVFSPGQVLEKQLGIDFATRVGRGSRIHRRLFGGAPGAPGITSTQAAGTGIPVNQTTRHLNLFLQYKRPESFSLGHRSTLWPRDEEFLRFTVSENIVGGGHHFTQIAAMEALASALGPSAIVRYACPSVWTKRDLYGSFSSGLLIDRSVFVAPNNLRQGPSGYHRRWTFQQSNPRLGKPNPDGPLTRAENGAELFELAADLSQNPARSRNFPDKLLEEASEVRAIRPVIRHRRGEFSQRVRREVELEDERLHTEAELLPSSERQLVQASLEIATAARDIGLQWNVLVVD